MRKRHLLGLMTLIVTSLSACSKSADEQTGVAKSDTINSKKPLDEKIEIGTYINGIYENRYFGLRVPAPAGWFAMDDAQRIQMMKMGAKLLAGDDKNFEAMLNSAQIKNINMFSYFERTPGTATEKFNPSILGVAEDVSLFPSVKVAQDYLENVRTALQVNKNLAITLEPGYGKETISGKSFDFMMVRFKLKSFDISQKYLSRFDPRQKYMLSFIISYANDEQKKAVEQALAKVELAK